MHEVLKEVLEELHRASQAQGHPFRTAVLASATENNEPHQRTVVLRDFNTQNFECVFFTDSRSEKVAQLQQQPAFSLLFYDSERQLQLRCRGQASILGSGDTRDAYFYGLTAKQLKDYQTVLAPGTPLALSETVSYNPSLSYFSVVLCTITEVDWLKLDPAGHQRIFFRKDKNGWKEQDLIP